MGGKKHKHLGRSLIKDRFSGQNAKKRASNTMLHTADLDDGQDWNRINLQSVTEESTFQEFLSTAQLADTDFQAEKLNVKFVNPKVGAGLPNPEELAATRRTQSEYMEVLKIPRRPAWNSLMSRSELDSLERDQFLEWRRSLSKLQEMHGLILTPYEKNLDFWRQLWRVVERSDIIVQIVDARNPLLFRCEDLEKYVHEVSRKNINMILINKSDFLTVQQRKCWSDYFNELNINIAFYSSLERKSDINSEKGLNMDNVAKELQCLVDGDLTSRILTRDELIDLFKSLLSHCDKNVKTVGFVGYPNVGKSSLINSLLASKKVSVSATPGKTKHFQTHYFDKELMLCDCPGLVMPSFMLTKAEMVCSGILPIDQMKDHVPPVSLVCILIPRHILEYIYGLMLPKPAETEDADRPPTAEELLNSYGFIRGFMTANGQPDNARTARYILKDYLSGKLLYCHSPPGINQTMYHFWPEQQKTINPNRILPPRQIRATKLNRITTEDVDKTFFTNLNSSVHVKGIHGTLSAIDAATKHTLGLKPWKMINKHVNKNRKEKLRRVYSHLDCP